MDRYIVGSMIKKIREEKKMTQTELAVKLHVSDKTVSKWETGKGYPDITLVGPLAEALGISVIELMSGNGITNSNRCSDMTKIKFYVCPICGNVIWSTGEAVVSCCGIVLPPLEPEQPDGEHMIYTDRDDDEYYVTFDHEMTKTHSITFAAAIRDNSCEIVRFYPEWNAEARFKVSRTGKIYWYCNRHGLFEIKM